ncbi:hypothetical protein [Acinetobacter johnsonii]|jgi:hypothetical protein|nr:hypothetical protein [Acinetobacter johnsonii]MDH1278249.1 hypothetical protein [Acinetobacter johnsonii]MDH1712755.1 hypothetical protein [Acinetobacter johnsonii]
MIEDFYLVQLFIRYEKSVAELSNVNAYFNLKTDAGKKEKQHG